MAFTPGGIIAGTARYYFRAMIPVYIREGMSTVAITSIARREGFSYRRTDMLRDIREFTGLMRHEGAVRATPTDQWISRGSMTDIDLKRDRRYRGFADATFQNIETGETRKSIISFYDDEQRTADEWAEEWDEQRREKLYREDEELVGFEMRALEHQAGWAY